MSSGSGLGNSAGFQQRGSGNRVSVGANVELLGYVNGDNNQIEIRDTAGASKLHLFINGDNNRVFIDRDSEIKGLGICCGNHIRAHNTVIQIGPEFTIEAGGRFFLYNSGNRLTIGRECMFSSSITLRCGESPHLIFDSESGAYLDISEGVDVGNHVWVGEGVYITKSVSIADETEVGACSVVTKRFSQTHVALAGNPARVVREHVQWIRNPGLLQPGSAYHASYHAQAALFPQPLTGDDPAAMAPPLAAL